MKVNGPLLSVEASGKFAKDIVFSKRKTGQQVRLQRAPKKQILTPSRADHRRIYNLASDLWLLLPDEISESYKKTAKETQHSAWNEYVKQAYSFPAIHIFSYGLWAWNEKDPETVKNISGIPNHLQITSDPVLGRPRSVSGLLPYTSNAWRFEGGEQSMYVTGTPKYDLWEGFTAFFTIKPDFPLSGLKAIFANGVDDGSTLAGWAIGLLETGALICSVAEDDPGVSLPLITDDGKPHRCAVRVDEYGNKDFFWRGLKITQTPGDVTVLPEGGETFCIGNAEISGDMGFEGVIDDPNIMYVSLPDEIISSMLVPPTGYLGGD